MEANKVTNQDNIGSSISDANTEKRHIDSELVQNMDKLNESSSNNLVSLSEQPLLGSMLLNANNNSPIDQEMDSSENKSAKKRKFACVECRQQKSKCDAHDRAPLPCTKCDKKGVQCVLKKDFRRTYKRAKNEAIEKRFKELTKSLSNLSSEQILKRIEREQMDLLDNSNFTKEKVQHRRSKLQPSNGISFNSNIADTLSPLSNISYSSNNSNRNGHNINANNKIENGDENFAGYKNCMTSIHGMTDEQLKCSPKSLGDIYLSSQDIAELFQEFATRYHQFLPVVNLERGTERIYNLSPCLFWVIILIGIRRRPDSSDLMKRLTVLVKATLAEITISPIIRYTPSETDEPILNVASVYSVQAFLLYTFWPPLTSSLSADTSWNTIGTALFQAIRVGLNTADFSQEFATENSELINEQRRTWVCCNVVSQIIASSFGFPAYVSFDHSVISTIKDNINAFSTIVANPSDIPLELKQMTQIAYFENQIVSTMNSNTSHKLGMVTNTEKLPLLHVLNQQLAELEMNLEEKSYLDNIRKYYLLTAKVHLLTYYFIDPDSKNNGNSTTSFDTKCGLVKVYNAAVNLLTHAHQMYEADPKIIKYFPGVFILNIWQTACIISKLVHSSLSVVIDVPRGKTAYLNAITLTYKASVMKHDMSYRSSGIMRSIWSLFNNMYQDWKQSNPDTSGKEFNLDITVQSRMSVSVFFDCLYILKAKCGIAKLEREKKQSKHDQAGRSNSDSNLSAEEEDDEENDSENNKSRHDEDINSEEHPERKARRIIETIPLDPNPINASTIKSNRDDLSSTITTPTNPHLLTSSRNKENERTSSFSTYSSTPSLTGTPNGGTTLSAESLLKRNTADYSSNFINSNKNNVTVGQTPGDNTNSQSARNNAVHSEYPIQEDGLFQGAAVLAIDPNMKIPLDGNHPNGDTIDHEADGKTETNSNSTKESPNSIMANWDNWESDMVWKDVDILMNEFAFNPTV